MSELKIKLAIFVAFWACYFYYLSYPAPEETTVSVKLNIAATPEQIWPFLTDPEFYALHHRMAFETLHSVNGKADEPGSVRRLNFLRSLPLMHRTELLVLDLKTEQGTQYPSRFVYTVLRCPCVFENTGEVTISTDPQNPGESVVEWRVTLTMCRMLHSLAGDKAVSEAVRLVLVNTKLILEDRNNENLIP